MILNTNVRIINNKEGCFYQFVHVEATVFHASMFAKVCFLTQLYSLSKNENT